MRLPHEPDPASLDGLAALESLIEALGDPDAASEEAMGAVAEVADAVAHGEPEALRPRVRAAALEAWTLEPVTQQRPVAPVGPRPRRALRRLEDSFPARGFGWSTSLRVAAVLLVALAIGLAFVPRSVTSPATADVDLAYVAGRRWRVLEGEVERRGGALRVRPGARIAWEPDGLTRGARRLSLDMEPGVDVVAWVGEREVGRAQGGEVLELCERWYGGPAGQELVLEIVATAPPGDTRPWVSLRGVTFRWNDRGS